MQKYPTYFSLHFNNQLIDFWVPLNCMCVYTQHNFLDVKGGRRYFYCGKKL
jgi:hypothetical protein